MILHTRTFHDGRWSDDGLPRLDSDATLVVAFGGRAHGRDSSAVDALLAAYPTSHVIGCSTSGEILGGRLRDDTLTVAVARFDGATLASASAPVTEPGGSYEAGRTLAHDLARDDLRAVFVLSDGLSVDGSELSRGLNEGLPADAVVTGGLAGDGDRFEETWVMAGGPPAPRRVAAVGFSGGSLVVGYGSRGGWDIFGPERVVTRAEGSELYELDGRPALGLYKEYLGDLADELPASGLRFPLAVHSPELPDQKIVRTILAVDHDAQSLTYAGSIREGSVAQLMRANFDRLIDGAGDAALRAERPPDVAGDTLAIDISCVGRRLVLGERCEEEIEAVTDALPHAGHIGFYSYGELSPLRDGTCDLHNQTMTITVVAERVP